MKIIEGAIIVFILTMFSIGCFYLHIKVINTEATRAIQETVKPECLK